MSLRRPLVVALTGSVALAGLFTIAATSASGAPSTNVHPRAAVSNTSTWAAIKTIVTGANGVNSGTGAIGIAVNGADDTVYVVNWLSGDAGSMTVINGTIGAVSNTVAPLPGYGRAVAVDQNDDTIYTITGNSPGEKVQSRAVTNPDDSVSNQSIPSAQFLAVDSLDDTVYVSRSDGNNITYFSGRTPTTVPTKNVGGITFGIAVDALDDSVWMAMAIDDSVRAWNGRTDALGPFIGVGDQPVPVAVNGPDDTVYVGHAVSSTIAVIDGRTSALVSTLSVGYQVSTTGGLAVDDSSDRLFAATTNQRLGIINGANTADRLVLSPRTGSSSSGGVTVTFRGVAVDDSGPNQGLVWAAGANPSSPFDSYVQAFAQVSPTLQGTTTGASGATVTVGVTPTPAVAFDLDDSTVWGIRFNGNNLVQAPTPGSGNTWFVPLPSGLPAGDVPVEVYFNGGQYALAGTYTVQSPATPTPTPSPTPTQPAQPQPPGAPGPVLAQAGDRSAEVTWGAPSFSGSGPVTEYEAEAFPGGNICRATPPTTSCKVTGLSNGSGYIFRARAKNYVGWGSWSEYSNMVTPKGAASIVITGSRDSKKPKVIKVSGTTTGLTGSVTPWLRLGAGSFKVEPPVRLTSSGTFRWSVKTSAAAQVYVTQGSVKSNTVTIRAR